MPWLLISFLAVGLLWALYLLGWFSAPRPWQESTGWDRVDPALLPGPYEPGDNDPWIRWLGHSGFVVYWHGTTLLLDPNLSKRCTVSRRVMQVPAFDGTPTPSSALISHAHFDHLNQDTLVSLKGLRDVFVPRGSETFLDRVAARGLAVKPVDIGASFVVGSLRITPVRSAHNGNRFHPLRSRFDAIGYMIQAPDGRTLYYAGDTAYGGMDWDSMRDRFHPDIAILPIGAYAPRIPLKYHHLNPEEAVMAAERLGVGRVIPCHFGTFTLSFDRPQSALPRFAAAMRGQAFAWSMPPWMESGDLDRMLASRQTNNLEDH